MYLGMSSYSCHAQLDSPMVIVGLALGVLPAPPSTKTAIVPFEASKQTNRAVSELRQRVAYCRRPRSKDQYDHGHSPCKVHRSLVFLAKL